MSCGEGLISKALIYQIRLKNQNVLYSVNNSDKFGQALRIIVRQVHLSANKGQVNSFILKKILFFLLQTVVSVW